MQPLIIQQANVIECRFFTSRSHALEQSARTVKHYELDYNISGGRSMTVDDEVYIIEKDSVVFRRPGQRVRSEGLYNMYVLSFTFDAEQARRPYHRNSEPAEAGREENAQLLPHLPTYLKPAHPEEVRELYRSLLYAFRRADGQALCAQLVTKLLCSLSADSIKILPCAGDADEVDAAIAYIAEHYSEPLSLEQLAATVHLNKSYFTRRFKAAVGKPPMAYLTEVRLANAKTMLMETDLSVSAIAALCGFADAAYFVYRFRREVGVAPGRFRRG